MGDAAAVWVLALGYAAATAVSLHAGESLELGEEVFSNNCGERVSRYIIFVTVVFWSDA